MKKYLLLIIGSLFSLPVFAGKMIAGEISYGNISGLTYEFTITIYQLSTNPDTTIEVDVGGGSSTATLTNDTSVGTLCSLNVIKSTCLLTHTYAGNGIYNIYVFASNRIADIVNIPNSINVNFSLKSTIVISSFLGGNTSPVFNSPLIDIANLDTPYIYNPSAYDVNGDSLSYQAVPPLGAGGNPILGYTFPLASNSFSIDSVTGNMLWDNPNYSGYYSVGFQITEWRQGQIIGTTLRDMLLAVCQPNAITEYQNEKDKVKLFPNPATNTFTITNLSSNAISLLQIINPIGEVVYAEKVYGKKEYLIDANFAKGIYFVRVNDVVRKLVVE